MIYPHCAEDSLPPIHRLTQFGLVSLGWYSHPITRPSLSSATGLVLQRASRLARYWLPHSGTSTILGEIVANQRTSHWTVYSPVPIRVVWPVVYFRLPS